MNRVLRIDEEKPEMHISVQGYKVTLCFAEKENPEVAVLVKQVLLSAISRLRGRISTPSFAAISAERSQQLSVSST